MQGQTEGKDWENGAIEKSVSGWVKQNPGKHPATDNRADYLPEVAERAAGDQCWIAAQSAMNYAMAFSTQIRQASRVNYLVIERNLIAELPSGDRTHLKTCVLWKRNTQG